MLALADPAAGVPGPPEIVQEKAGAIPDIVLAKQWQIQQPPSEQTQYCIDIERVGPSNLATMNLTDGVYFICPKNAGEPTGTEKKFIGIQDSTHIPQAFPPTPIQLAEAVDLNAVPADGGKATLKFSSSQLRREAYDKCAILLRGSQTSCMVAQWNPKTQNYNYLGIQTGNSPELIRGLGTEAKIEWNWKLEAHNYNYNSGDPNALSFIASLPGLFGSTRWHELNVDNSGNISNRGTTLGKSQSGAFLIFKITGYHEENPTENYAWMPKEGTEYFSFPANEYVLKAAYDKGSKRFIPDTYDLLSFKELNWHMRDGKQMGSEQVTDESVYIPRKMIDIKQACTWGIGVDLGFFGRPLTSTEIISVPVGSLPPDANGNPQSSECMIPTGTLAFRVNDLKPGTEAYVRTVIKIPQRSDPYQEGQTVNKLGLWKGQQESNWLKIPFIRFQKDQPTNQHIVTPISQKLVTTYDPATQQETTSTAGRALTVRYQGQEYKTYLQGETVLLAVEYNLNDLSGSAADKKGVFVLAESDEPLQLVYGAANGVASGGRDGTGGSVLGSIDFVYANKANKVIPVTIPAPKTAPETVQNLQTYYYPSNVLLRFNNAPHSAVESGKYPMINSEVLKIHRSLRNSLTVNGVGVDLTVGRAKGWSDKDVQILGSGASNDNVIKK